MRKKGSLRLLFLLLIVSMIAVRSGATTKVHVIAFGKWVSVQWLPDSVGKPVPLKVRALVVDGRIREYAIGTPHEVTERLFVVQRVFRVNDSLPEDAILHWQWQRGGWLLIDRLTGRVSPSVCPGSTTITRLRVGTATTFLIAESLTTARKSPQRWCNSIGASPS